LTDSTAINIELFGLVATFQKSFAFVRRFSYYCCLPLIRTHFCFSFENDLSYDWSKR